LGWGSESEAGDNAFAAHEPQRTPAPDAYPRYFSSDPTELGLSVSAVVRRRSGSAEILLMQRADNGQWGLPGGYVERGESVEQACAREVLEETGYRVVVGRLIGVYSEPARQVVEYGEGRRVHVVNLCFEAVPESEDEPRSAPTTPEETLCVRFFEDLELPKPFVPIHEVRVTDAVIGEVAAAVR
jgi:ADP-ribose pyrophosphatase YjhB (NUDIX family)